MFIRKIMLLIPVIFAINAHGEDSAAYYLRLGKELLDNNQLVISEKYFKKAIHFSTDTTTTVNSLIYLGISLKKLGKYDLGIACYQKADSISHDPETKASLYINMAIIYRLEGDYNKALAYYNKALGLSKWPYNLTKIYNNLAIVYYNKGDALKALGFYKKSWGLKSGHSPQTLSSVYLNMALCYEKLDSIRLADYYFTKTIKECTRLYGEKHPVLIMAYLNCGNFFLKSNPEKSLNLLGKANKLALLNYGKEHVETVQTFICLGNYFSFYKNYEKALAYYQKALISNNKIFESKDFYKSPGLKGAISELDQVEILHRKAMALKNYAHVSGNNQRALETSLATYELAIGTLFRLQNSFMDESKRTLIAEKKNMFAEAANVAIQLGDYPKAFQLIEKGKASTLLAAVNNNEAVRFGDIPDSLAALENEYKRLQFVYSSNGDADSSLYYQAKYDSLTAYFEANYPKYHQLKYSPATIDPCKQLDANQVLLEYALTDTLCITLVVTNEGYRHYSFPVDSGFYKQAETFIFFLNNYVLHERYNEQYEKIVSSGYYLWGQLIKPLNIPDGKSIHVIPDGILSYIPFDAMIYELPPAGGRYYFNLKYLVYKHPFSFAYSAKWLFEPFLGKPTKKIGAFALDYNEKDSMMPLQNTVPVAKNITKFFRGKAYLNENCTKEAFFNRAGEYEILHLGMHGDVVYKNEVSSRLFFHNDDLYSWEVYGMNLNARLAYLSACNTGDGLLDKGEGIFSMGRAFAYAGCVSLVTSLWAEKDNLPGITLDFYKYVRKGYPLDMALQQAKIKYLSEKHRTHPHYWANKILVGKTAPIKQTNWLFIIIGAAIILTTLIIKFFKQK